MIYLTNNDMAYEGVINLPLLSIKYNTIDINLDTFDCIVVTSKNSIKALQSSNKIWKQIPIYSISKPTTDYIISCGGNVQFSGNSGHGNDFANELIKELANKKVLYLKAKEVVSDLENILKSNNIDLVSYVAYEGKCETNLDIKIESHSYIIFTSPSSIKCFLQNFIWDKTNKAICIGKTTASFLPKDIEYLISSKTSIDECIKLAKSLIKS